MKKLQCFCTIKRVLQRSIAMICMACNPEKPASTDRTKV